MVNSSFECPTPPSGYVTVVPGGSYVIPGWTITRGSVDHVGSRCTSSDGKGSIDLDGGAAGTMTQTFNTIAGRTYTVSFDLAGNPDGSVKEVRVSAAGQSATRSFRTAGKSFTNMGWVRAAPFQFTANSSSATLEFFSLSAMGSLYGPALDNVCVAERTTACNTGASTPGGGGTLPTTPPVTNYSPGCAYFVRPLEYQFGQLGGTAPAGTTNNLRLSFLPRPGSRRRRSTPMLESGYSSKLRPAATWPLASFPRSRHLARVKASWATRT